MGYRMLPYMYQYDTDLKLLTGTVYVNQLGSSRNKHQSKISGSGTCAVYIYYICRP